MNWKKMAKWFGAGLLIFILYIAIINILKNYLFPRIGFYAIEMPFKLVFGWISYISKNHAIFTNSLGYVFYFAFLLTIFVFSFHLFIKKTKIIKNWSFKLSIKTVVLLLSIITVGAGSIGVFHQTIWILTSPNTFIRADSFYYNGEAKVMLAEFHEAQKEYFRLHGKYLTDIEEVFKLAKIDTKNPRNFRYGTFDVLTKVEESHLSNKISLEEVKMICPDCYLSENGYKIVGIMVREDNFNYEVLISTDKKHFQVLVADGVHRKDVR